MADLPIKFLWATFCKSVVTTPETGDVNINGVLTGLAAEGEVQINDDGAIAKNIAIQLGSVTVVAFFQRLLALDQHIDVGVELEILIPTREPQKVQRPIKIEADKDHAILNIKVEGVGYLLPNAEGSYNNVCTVRYLYEGQELGRAELPVRTRLSTPAS
ncbi:hypothetical protein Pse7367_0571 [Thalassoporum mexicanum PCC 7367]|uniref:hypothetical protein n=1 Tax=Thalassoporum mexicanum TaxID=3457544 RepID=UPI00029FFC24|nr:hypothetical protein [Pseudanabaena sp. PCC 7367]AFY68876.1 hypothetical protein Pse7367_0571 [Pseudanabaena sp. PCC 7367]